MNIEMRFSESLYKTVHSDLNRRHSFAAERVGFVKCGLSQLNDNDLLILGSSYQPVDDEDYIRNPKAGATMGSPAIRKALQAAYNEACSMFHVHRHDHNGIPKFSRTDLTESYRFVPDFFKVQPSLCHGVLVLSYDSAIGLCWLPNVKNPISIKSISVNGKSLSTRRLA